MSDLVVQRACVQNKHTCFINPQVRLCHLMVITTFNSQFSLKLSEHNFLFYFECTNDAQNNRNTCPLHREPNSLRFHFTKRYTYVRVSWCKSPKVWQSLAFFFNLTQWFPLWLSLRQPLQTQPSFYEGLKCMLEMSVNSCE